MLEIIILLLSFSLGYFVGSKSQKVPDSQNIGELFPDSQNIGELMVQEILMEEFSGSSFHLMNNLTLPWEDGTTQIDHVLVARVGIFVIETKHYKGWLFANPKAASWTQVIFKKKYQFQNPLHQNYKHLKAVQKILDFIPSEHIHSLVVFTGDAQFKTERPMGVFTLLELPEYLHSFTTQVISQNRLQFSVGRLECFRLAISQETDVEHQAYLDRRFSRGAHW